MMLCIITYCVFQMVISTCLTSLLIDDRVQAVIEKVVDGTVQVRGVRKMAQMLMEVSSELQALPEQERTLLINAGLYEAKRAWAKRLKADIMEASEHIKGFEERYGVSFIRFEREMLPTLDTLQAHEDYNDWFFWHSVWVEKQGLLSKLHLVGPA